MEEAKVVNEASLVKPEIVMDLEVKLPEIKEISHNLNLLETRVEELKEFYTKLVVQEKDVDVAKKDRADINKFLKKIEDNRKDTIKKYKEPIDDFENTSKRIEKLLKGTAETIGSKIEVYTEKYRNEKKIRIGQIITNCYNDLFEEDKPKIDMSRFIFNEKWYNKEYDLENSKKVQLIEEEIKTQFAEMIDEVNRFDKDVFTIKEYVLAIRGDDSKTDLYIERYKYTKDLQQVMFDIKGDFDEEQETKKVEDIFSSNNVEDIFSATETISIKGTKENIEKVKKFALELGMEIL